METLFTASLIINGFLATGILVFVSILIARKFEKPKIKGLGKETQTALNRMHHKQGEE